MQKHDRLNQSSTLPINLTFQHQEKDGGGVIAS